MRVRFAKYQGLGNDFVILKSEDATISADQARRLCDRRRGIGADGVLTVFPPSGDDAVARMHVFNADGSEAQMCGNGLRCVVRWLGRSERVGIETGAGLLYGREVDVGIEVTMGPASRTHDRVETEIAAGVGVSMGNPHLVLDPFSVGTDLMALARQHGPALEHHPEFPERTNVELATIAADGSIDLVVFERGSGITDACGTGASATVAAFVWAGHVEAGRPITVRLPGGPLAVTYTTDQVTIAGEATHVFDGEVEL